MLRISGRGKAQQGWLAAIRGLPNNPAFQYLTCQRRNSWRMLRQRRLQFIHALALPVLVLTWLAADTHYIWLDPRHATFWEWLRVYLVALRDTGKGLYEFCILAGIPWLAIWFTVRIYRWTVDCVGLLTPRRMQRDHLWHDTLRYTPLSTRDLLVAVVAAQLRSLAPLLLVLSASLALFTFVSINTQYYYVSDGPMLLSTTDLRIFAVITIWYGACFFLGMLLNTLILIHLGQGIRTHLSAPATGVLMVLAQGLAILQLPYLYESLNSVLYQENAYTFSQLLNTYVICMLAFISFIFVLIALNRRPAGVLSDYLPLWPLSLLTVLILPLLSQDTYICSLDDFFYEVQGLLAPYYYGTSWSAALRMAWGTGAVASPASVLIMPLFKVIDKDDFQLLSMQSYVSICICLQICLVLCVAHLTYRAIESYRRNME